MNQTAVMNKLEKLFDYGNQLFPTGKLKLDDFDVRFTLRGATAGKANYSKRTLWFHPEIMKRNSDEYEQTIIHEVAHLYQRKLYPTSNPHGREWKRIARKLGYTGERCHSYDTSGLGRVKTRYIYKCKECGMEYKLTKHKHQHAWRYACGKCMNKLQFTGEVIKFR